MFKGNATVSEHKLLTRSYFYVGAESHSPPAQRLSTCLAELPCCSGLMLALDGLTQIERGSLKGTFSSCRWEATRELFIHTPRL